MDEGKNKGLLQSSAILTLWLISFVHAATEHTPQDCHRFDIYLYHKLSEKARK